MRTECPNALVADPTASGFSHRPALDGLRGVAVLAVIAHHGGYLTGGYLGVDLFFVLSGFLITSLMLAEQDRTGTVDRGAFWARRARRLLPASWLVITVVTVVASIGATTAELADLRRDALGAVFYVENWVQASINADYWDRFTAPSPFRHFWSLAIEEQFYILWPLAFAGIVALARRVRDRFDTARLLGAFAVAAACGSYALGMWRFNPGVATTGLYYGTFTRVGAIFAGVAVAAVQHRFSQLGDRPRFNSEGVPARSPRPTGWGREAAALLAGGVLVTMWATVEGTSPFLWRGGLALAGLAAAALIALFGSTAPPRSAALLRNPVLMWFGEISYGLYLWHWPIFVAVDTDRTGLAGPGLFAARCALSLLAAVASFYLLERPIRQRKFAGSRLPARQMAGVGALAALVMLSSVVWSTQRGANASANHDESIPPASPGGVVAPGVTPRILVLGDSVAVNLGEAMARLSGEKNIEVRSDGRLGCPITDGPSKLKTLDGLVIPDPAYCDVYEQSWAEEISTFTPNVILLIIGSPVDGLREMADGRWVNACDPGGRAWFEKGLEYGMSQLTGRGIPIVMPTIPYYRGRNAPPNADELTDCRNDVVRSVTGRHEEVHLIDLAGWVCPAGECREEIAGVVARPDGAHFSDEVAPVAVDWILGQVRRAG